MKLKYILLILAGIFTFSCVDFDDNSGFTDEDKLPEEPTEGNDVRMWVTTQSGVFLMKEQPIDYSDDISSLTLSLDAGTTYQTIDGYGGTLTGSSAYLFMQMSPERRTAVLKSLFDPKEGIGLESIRISIGASDFSLALYTYCDEQGIENFEIPEYDKRDLIPVLKEILAINPNVKLMASPWSPPAWMKTSGNLNFGSLIGAQVYDDYATYFVKYIKAMQAEGIQIDAITLQNEADFESGVHPSMKMSWEEQADIIANYLGPKFQSEGITSKILILDHNFDIYTYALNILANPAANKYVSGTAFHGYNGKPDAIDNLVSQYPDKSIYQTEMSGGGWNTGEEMQTMFYYLNDFLIPTMQKGSSNFMMFNIALNSQHGPVTPGGTFCEDCRGIVTIDGNESKIELEYYLLGHSSKISRSGAKMIKSTFIGNMPSGLTSTAFLNPDGSKGLVLVNGTGMNQNITITVKGDNRRLVYGIPPSSVASFLIK